MALKSKDLATRIFWRLIWIPTVHLTMMFARVAASRFATRTGVRMASTVVIRASAPKMAAVVSGLAVAATAGCCLAPRTACDGDDDVPLPVYGKPGTNQER